jgi:SHAQKYF class myb-like DNA-binding protein
LYYSNRLFLAGPEKYGKGDWRSISINFVVTRTPTQVASRAQKYFSHNQQKSARIKRGLDQVFMTLHWEIVTQL